MRIMRPFQRRHAHILGIGLIAAFAAGCSSDTSRFGDDPFSNPFRSKSEVTNTAPAQQPQPQAQIESRPLDTPIAANPPRTVPAAPAPAIATIHTVNQSDTLLSIARRYKIGAAELARANKLDVHARLKLGQRITIPGSSRTATQPAPARRVQAPVQTPLAPQQEKVANVKAIEQPEPAVALTGTPQFRWPVKGRVISGFGQKPNGQQNDGINLSVPEGTPIKASEDGVVAYAGNELKGYGNLVLIRHAEGWVTAYAHASEVLVKRGEAVKRGQVIARAGQTGGVPAPQLHFEIRKGATPVDPTQHLSSL